MIQFLKTRNVRSPERGTKGSSGIDFFIPNDLLEVKVTPSDVFGYMEPVNFKQISIEPGTGILIPTGIKTIIPEGYEMVMYNKSGIAVKKGLIVGAQVIDSDYRGEIHIHLINTTNAIIPIDLGEKVVQGIIRKVELWNMNEITKEEFEKQCNTERGEGGFGSTGTK